MKLSQVGFGLMDEVGDDVEVCQNSVLSRVAKTYVGVARLPQVDISKWKSHGAQSMQTHTETMAGICNPPGSSQNDEYRRT